MSGSGRRGEFVRVEGDGWAVEGTPICYPLGDTIMCGSYAVAINGFAAAECVVAPITLTTALAERDRARDIAARLEGELARVREAIQLAIDTEQIPDWDGEPILLCPDWCWTKLAEHLLTVIAEDGAS